jgi:hypothetical protein
MTCVSFDSALDYQVAVTLLATGADVCARNSMGETSLLRVVRHVSDLRSIHELLGAGADLDTPRAPATLPFCMFCSRVTPIWMHPMCMATPLARRCSASVWRSTRTRSLWRAKTLQRCGSNLYVTVHSKFAMVSNRCGSTRCKCAKSCSLRVAPSRNGAVSHLLGDCDHIEAFSKEMNLKEMKVFFFFFFLVSVFATISFASSSACSGNVARLTAH